MEFHAQRCLTARASALFAKPATSPRRFLHQQRREGNRQTAGNGAMSAGGGDCAVESFSHRSRGVAMGGGRHQEPHPLFQVLPEAADGEGHDRKNRSGQSEIAQTGVQAGMSYYINNTMSIGLPFCPQKNIQQPLSNPAPTIGNLNPSTTTTQP